MLDLVQIADACQGIGPVVRLLKNGIMPIFQIGVPILLIVFGSIDLGKAVMAITKILPKISGTTWPGGIANIIMKNFIFQKN